MIEKQKKHSDLKFKTIEIIEGNNVDVHITKNGLKTSKVVFVSEEVNAHTTKNDLPEKRVVETTELEVETEELSRLEVHVTKNGLPESCVTKTSDLDIVSKEVNRPEDVLKSLPEYENWMRKLTSKLIIKSRHRKNSKVLRS